jgi:AraC-like DNA-binding protein
MLFHSYIPAAPLSDFVALFWLYEGYVQPHARERVLPDGSVELVVSLADSESRVYEGDPVRGRTFRNGVVAGARSEFLVIDTASQVSVMGVHFKPGGAFPFLSMPASELRNAVVALDDLWGAAAASLRARLLAAATAEAKFRLLEQTLLRQARRPLVRHRAVAYALGELQRGRHARSISDVTDETGLSARRFIQVFSDEVGLTPKLFCRVRRFQRVLRLIHRTAEIDWADVALSCGYFDQAHFIHDFQAFSGINPTTYLAHKTPHLNHVPL